MSKLTYTPARVKIIGRGKIINGIYTKWIAKQISSIS